MSYAIFTTLCCIMKKGIIYIITIVIIFSLILGLIGIAKGSNVATKNSNKIEIIATIFPQYDFAKQICGDRAEVSLLLTPGTETHTYEPTPQDIIKVNNSDLFIYTGDNMEPWAGKIAAGITSDVKILDASQNITLIKSEDDEDNDEHEYDPHIWLNPQNAIKMCQNILDTICEIDPENTQYYTDNCNSYISQISALDADFENLVSNSKNKKIAFGGTFAYKYFVERYDLEYVTAYDSCGEDAEPSVSKIKAVVDYIKENNLPVIFYQELSAGKIANSIASETGAKMLVFSTIHNVSADQMADGATYVSLMRQNYENLKIALDYDD